MYLYEHQKKAIEEQTKYKKCLINMWCGTGKTRTFTIDLFNHNEKTNVIVFPSLGLINQYSNDYVLSNEEPFKTEYEKYKCLAFCSDNDGKLKSKGTISFTTDEKKLNTFLKKRNNKMLLVTYQSFEKFINICSVNAIKINNLIFDEAHHIIGDKIQNIVFNNEKLDTIVDKTRYYTATPVNKNGIIMYDRDEPENSDCGPLAYEYLYYQAVEDGICKPFETQISLYTQKQEYKDKYQPIFESIIRACLSGKYNYWNILTYHSFVNENEDMNDNISFVKDFASTKNQKLVKKLFTKIQNEEFPHTKATYSVENVILKGVHSETHTRQQIIKDFDKKVPGRIYILSSCGILNEGIDTKWANMGIPINPSKSIVKESQRIGRLVRIPEKEMPPAIILIPCEVDITKYASMDTAELRDQMIREELSECGNFNTALNVISAFKYQYDPDLFEMCLKYPNMYAPKEVKDNLKKQGLIVEESKGTLLDNLKYICEQEDIELDTASFEGETESDILNEIAELSEKTIEIHTQNYDEPVKYINEEAIDDEPLRLFHCDDENSYAPIVNKDKKNKIKIKRRTTTAPKKRPKLFDIHTHPDLEVLWKISESSIDLTKTFSQGVLDVDINWNEKKWEEKYELLKALNKTPVESYITKCGVKLGNWCGNQKTKKKKGVLSQDKIDLLEVIPGWYWEQDLDQLWMNTYKLLEALNEMPSQSYITDCGVKLGSWCVRQRQDKKKGKLSQDKIELLEKIPGWFWELWMDTYKLLEALNETPVESYITKCGVNLGSWCNTQRTNKKKGKLSQYKIDLLEKIPGWFWELDLDQLWMDTYKLLEALNETPSVSYITECGVNLGSWCTKQRTKKKKGNLSQYKIDLLEKIPGWFWELDLDQLWMDTYKLLEALNETPSVSYITECGVNLGRWCDKQRTNKKKGVLSQVKIELLEKIPGWYWELDLDQLWMNNYELLKVLNETPAQSYITKCDVKLGSWCSRQKTDKKKGALSQDKIDLLEKIPGWYWEQDQFWMNNYELLKALNETPFQSYVTDYGIKLGSWCNNQRTNKKKGTLSQDRIDLLDKIPGWYWDKKKKDMSKPEIKPKKTGNEIRQQRALSELSQLHKEYKTMNSQNLNTYFKENTDKWNEYHKISKENEESFIEEEIPRNKMIMYLENLPGKKHKVIADLGCGFAEINQHFKDNSRFTFHNFDHISANDYVISRDIKNTGLDDYSVDNAILSLAMWGSNCKEYLKEAHRILDTGGTLLIAEAYKRWNKELDEHENPINRLVKLLEENNFTIIKNIENKFMFIECRKN
jgi:superfamily II DNA or RNA helicase